MFKKFYSRVFTQSQFNFCIVFLLVKDALIILIIASDLQPNDYFLPMADAGVAGNSTKTKRLNKDEIKEQLLPSLSDSKKDETEDLNEKADKVEKCEHSAIINKENGDTTRTKKKNIICISYQQCKVFRRYKEG